MHQKSWLLAILIGLLFWRPAGTNADSFTVEKIVDFETAIPGGKSTFKGFHNSSIGDGEDVAFRGRGKNGQRGVYLDKGGILSVLANEKTVLPGGGLLGTIHYVSMNRNGQVVFEAKSSNSRSGIYVGNGAKLVLVADDQTAIPGGTGNFTSLKNPRITDDGQVVFEGKGDGEQRGIYRDVKGVLSVVADTNTVLPGGAGLLATVRHLLINNNGQTVFEAKGSSGRRGIYLDLGGNLAVVADRTTLVPDGKGKFKKLRKPSLDANENVVFKGKGRYGELGIYAGVGGNLTVVANRHTAVPGGVGNFSWFGFASVDDGYVAFLASSSDKSGLFTNLGGTLASVLSLGDMLDGKKVATIRLFEPDGLKGNSLVFKVIFDDASRGIYRASLH